jgi:RHS repeat-associated protein
VGQYATIVYYSDTDGGTANLAMTATYTYDDIGDLTGLVYTDSSNATIRSFSWTYDELGQVVAHDSDLSAEDVTAYTYDATGQLLSTDYASSTDESYTYDDAGNRVEANGDTYTTGDNNETTSDGTYCYLYDGEGNLIAKYVDEDADEVLDSGDTDITQYTWDYRNRLAEVSHRDLFGGTTDWAAEYEYDAFNQRVASLYDNDGDGTVDKIERYVWDGGNVALDFVDSDGENTGENAASLALATRYLWGQAVDQLLAQETVDDGGDEDVSYIVRDNLDSTRSLVDHTGAVTNTYSYDSYGNVTATVGTLAATRYLYTCQEHDTATGLYYYDNRWYDSSLGKFISQDPIGFATGDANLYRYVGNMVTRYADSTGLDRYIVLRDGHMMIIVDVWDYSDPLRPISRNYKELNFNILGYNTRDYNPSQHDLVIRYAQSVASQDQALLDKWEQMSKWWWMGYNPALTNCWFASYWWFSYGGEAGPVGAPSLLDPNMGSNSDTETGHTNCGN